jgi:hypothetical protein
LKRIFWVNGYTGSNCMDQGNHFSIYLGQAKRENYLSTIIKFYSFLRADTSYIYFTIISHFIFRWIITA